MDYTHTRTHIYIHTILQENLDPFGSMIFQKSQPLYKEEEFTLWRFVSQGNVFQ